MINKQYQWRTTRGRMRPVIAHLVKNFLQFAQNEKISGWIWFMVFNATFSNISVILWQSVLLVEETGVPRIIQQPVASHWQILSHNAVLSTPCHVQGFELTTVMVISTDCTVSCKSIYHMITTTMTPQHDMSF